VGECEPPVVNTSPVTSVELRLYFIQSPAGDIVGWSPGPWPVGYSLRFDMVGRDKFNRETMGNKGSNPIFYYNDATLIEITDANHDFQRKLKILKPGNFQTWTIFDGVQSNTVSVTFIP